MANRNIGSQSDPDRDQIRLQKVLAQAGVGSRRACEELIDQGRVEVDGNIILEQGMRVDPRRQVIKVDGLRIPTAPDHVVLALNKPRGVHSTMTDDKGRPCVGDYLKGRKERLFHVGRLDADTEGLLLLTNDGALARHMELPTTGWIRRYRVRVYGPIDPAALRSLARGVTIEDVKYAPIEAAISCPISKAREDTTTIRPAKRERTVRAESCGDESGSDKSSTTASGTRASRAEVAAASVLHV